MKALATLVLLSALFLAAVLPGSSPVIESASDTFIAGKLGTGGTPPHPRTPDQPIFDINLGELIAGKAGTGGTPPHGLNEEPVFEIGLSTLMAGRVGTGSTPPHG